MLKAVGTVFESQLAALCQSVLTAPVQFSVESAVTQAENSDVSFVVELVAVAVTEWPSATSDGKFALIEALPTPSVVTFAEAKKRCPSPLPEASHASLSKNSTRKVVFAVELSVPLIWMWPLPMTAELRTGKFCELFGPASGSPASLGVTPSPPRSMPRSCAVAPLSWMEFERTELPAPPVTA